MTLPSLHLTMRTIVYAVVPVLCAAEPAVEKSCCICCIRQYSDRGLSRGGVKTAAYCIPLHTCILHTVAYLLHTCIPPPHTECAAYPVCSKKLHTVLHTRCVSAQAHELWDMVGDACLVSVVSPYVTNASPCSQMAVPITGVHH